MRLEGEFEVAASASRLWGFFWDVEALAACLPGCEGVKRVDERTFTGIVRARVGPVQARFEGKATVTEAAPPSRIALKAEGEDNRTASRVRATIELGLTPIGEARTRASYRADVTIVGRLGQFGDGIIRETARVLLEEFAGNVRSRLEGQGDPPQARRASMSRVLLKASWRWLSGGVIRRWHRLRGRPSRLLKKESPEGPPAAGGYPPLAGVWGCPPDTNSTPFLARKGAGGWSKGVFHHPARETSGPMTTGAR